MINLLTQKRKGDIQQTKAETPQEIIEKWDGSDSNEIRYFYIDLDGGSNDSINRLRNRNCVVAYYIFDRLGYMIIQNTSKQIRLYRLFNFDRANYRHCIITGEQVRQKYGDILKLDFTILNKDLFSQFKQMIMLDELTK